LQITIDPDIRKAKTLPSSFYSDESTFQKLKIEFPKSWHFAGHQSQLSENNVVPLDHMGDLVGEPMLMTGGAATHCISNVCTHRGMIVSNKQCLSQTLQCPYHGRTFGLDGRFRGMPEFDGVEDFPSPSDDLPQFPTMVWKGIVFTGTEPKGIEACLEELNRRLEWLPIESFQYDPSRQRSYEIKANWALYVDNYLEGFHIPFVHKDLHAALDYDNYSTELFEGGVLQIGIASEGEPAFDLPETSPDFGKSVAAYYYWIYPGLMLNFYPWGLSVNLVVPLSVDRTRIIYQGFVGDKTALGMGAGGDLDKVEHEDQEIVEATQRGVESGSYDRGRYSPSKEKGVHHFHRILYEFSIQS